MYKTPSYDIHAFLLIPAYNLPAGVLSHYVTTQHDQNDRGGISVDVWLVNAQKENPTESMIASLRKERMNYQTTLEAQLAKEAPASKAEKSLKICELKKEKELFAELITQAQDPVRHKQPAKEFLEVAQRNFARSGFSYCQPDLKNYLYLAGLSRCK